MQISSSLLNSFMNIQLHQSMFCPLQMIPVTCNKVVVVESKIIKDGLSINPAMMDIKQYERNGAEKFL